jgi:4-amino-4-deoxy-L-arabinose transferase-like glycosyltransferase
VAAITALRVLLLAFNRTDLFVDEAQYWLWGQELALGYYSKPPMIGWVIAAFTAFSDAPFWVRLPAPLFHAAAALGLGWIAARLFGPRAAVVTALLYVTLPMVALASLLISTDTIMFPFLIGAFGFYLRLLEKGELRDAAISGVLLGLAFLSKYAAIYFPLCGALAALLFADARPSWRTAAALLGAFLLTAAPNLLWNAVNGFTTLSHTLDNADWVRDPGARAGLNPGALAEFFASQFAVVGPVVFTVLLIVAARARRQPALLRFLLVFSLPILGVVCLQALLSRAYANWAASAYIAGTLIAVAWMLPRRRAWLWTAFGVNAVFSLALPLSTLAPEGLYLRGQQLLARYTGRAEMSEMILDIARDLRVAAVVASDRDVLADLFYSGRDAGVPLAAMPVRGRPPHHYAQRHAYLPRDEQVLLVLPSAAVSPCPPDAEEVAELTPTDGAYRTRPQRLYLVPGDCLAPR